MKRAIIRHLLYKTHQYNNLRSHSTELLSRGLGLYGALGTGDLLDSDEFKVININGLIPVKVSAGWGHSVVLTKCGQVILFGRPYDFSILFDDYFYQIISTKFLKSVYEYYHINNHDQKELYHHLYNIVEKMIIDKYESDADTVVEE